MNKTAPKTSSESASRNEDAQQAHQADRANSADDVPPEAASKTSRPRKERVLHTRVPEVLDRELKRLAESLRVPVSNVVRSILMDAVEAADAVTQMAEGEIRSVADRLHLQRDRLRRETTDALRAGPPLPGARRKPKRSTTDPAPAPPLAGVLGFQPLLLARATGCAVCGATLAAGSQAFVGITNQPGRTTIVGGECLPFSFHPPAPPATTPATESTLEIGEKS